MKVAVLFTLYVWCIFPAKASNVELVEWKKTSREFHEIENILNTKKHFDSKDQNELESVLEALQKNIEHGYKPGVYKVINEEGAKGKGNAELTKESKHSDELNKNELAYFTEFRIRCEISSNAEPDAAINPVCRIRALASGSFPKLWYTIVAYYFKCTSIKTFFEPSALKKLMNTKEGKSALKKLTLMVPKLSELIKTTEQLGQMETWLYAFGGMIVILIVVVVYLLYCLYTIHTSKQNEHPQLPNDSTKSQDTNTSDAKVTTSTDQETSHCSTLLSSSTPSSVQEIDSPTNTELISNEFISISNPVTHSISFHGLHTVLPDPEAISEKEATKIQVHSRVSTKKRRSSQLRRQSSYRRRRRSLT